MVALTFQQTHPQQGKGMTLRDGLSAVVQIGKTLWLANDETVHLERLTLAAADDNGISARCGAHASFALAEYLDLPAPANADPEKIEEADLEGLAYANGYLWLTGSHSLKRKKPKLNEGVAQASKQLAKVGRDGNRFLLARIPVLRTETTCSLARHEGERHAARLAGDHRGNELTEALRHDAHLADFLAIPGKDNGFDIEGLAVIDDRLFLGLRSPVLRGWAVILEVEPASDTDAAGFLHLKTLPSEQRCYRKHFLQLGGLGIRDLCQYGEDLLILAGPSMALDGPVRLLRWPGGAKRHQAGAMVADTTLERIHDIPHGDGVDHAEGMTLFSFDGGITHAALVVYDSAADSRKQADNSVLADVFALPTVA